MGLSERQVLMQVELPLGLPLVIAGIRIAAIFVIATATIAGGRGRRRARRDHRQPGELRACGRRRRRALRLGAHAARGAPASACCAGDCRLALSRERRLQVIHEGGIDVPQAHTACGEGILRRLTRSRASHRPSRQRRRGATPAAKPTVTIGSKNFTEQFILGQLYKQALEAKGYKVDYKENIGSSELIDTALQERQDQLLSGVHRRHRRRPRAEDGAEDRRRGLRGGEEVRGTSAVTTILEQDAVLRLGLVRDARRRRRRSTA